MIALSLHILSATGQAEAAGATVAVRYADAVGQAGQAWLAAASAQGPNWLEHLARGHVPSGYLGPWWLELGLVALGFTAVMMLTLRLCRLAGPLRLARAQATAAAYGVLLYRRSPRAVVRYELRLMAANLRLILWLLPVIAVGSLLFVVAYGPLKERYGYAPARVGEAITVRMRAATPSAAGLPAETTPVALPAEATLADGDIRLAAQVTVPALGTSWFRLVPQKRGLWPLVTAGGHKTVFLNVDRGGNPASPWQLFAGGDIHMAYPPRATAGGMDSWLLCLLLWCLAWPVAWKWVWP